MHTVYIQYTYSIHTVCILYRLLPLVWFMLYHRKRIGIGFGASLLIIDLYVRALRYSPQIVIVWAD